MHRRPNLRESPGGGRHEHDPERCRHPYRTGAAGRRRETREGCERRPAGTPPERSPAPRPAATTASSMRSLHPPAKAPVILQDGCLAGELRPRDESLVHETIAPPWLRASPASNWKAEPRPGRGACAGSPSNDGSPSGTDPPDPLVGRDEHPVPAVHGLVSSRSHHGLLGG